jgi:hypothetical protein
MMWHKKIILTIGIDADALIDEIQNNSLIPGIVFFFAVADISKRKLLLTVVYIDVVK